MTSPVSAIEDIEAALNEAPICEYPDFTNAVREVLALARQAEALQRENAELRAVMKECHAALKMMISPGDISGSTVLGAFAAAKSAEARARALLGGENAGN